MSDAYVDSPLTRDEVDAVRGPLVLEFGAPWCGICAAARPALDAAFAAYPSIDRRKIWDGSGKPLGRSFGIKLWPTLVLLRDGAEIERLVRPTDSRLVAAALGRLAGGG